MENHLIISVGSQNSSALSYQTDDGMLKYIKEQFDISFSPVQIDQENPSYSYRLLAASQSLPDVMLFDAKWDFSYFIKQQAIRPLPQNMTMYPHLNAFITYPYARAFQNQGKLYGIPRSIYSEEQSDIMYCVVMHKDIFEKTQCAPPKTLEEYYQLLSKIKQNNPFMIPLTSQTPDAMFNLTGYISPATNTWIWDKELLKYVPGYITKDFVSSIKSLQKFYQADLLDTQFMNVDSGRPTGTDLFLNKHAAGILYPLNMYDLQSKLLIEYKMLYPNSSPNDDFIVFFLPPDTNNEYKQAHTLNLSTVYFGNNVSDQKLERILTLLDFLCSEKGLLFRRYGIENIDYTLNEKGEVYPLLSSEELYQKYPSYSFFRVFPSHDYAFMRTNSDHPFLSDLVKQYEDFKLENKFFPLYQVSLLANTLLSTTDTTFTHDLNEMRFFLLNQPDVDYAFELLLKDYEENGIIDFINKVNWSL